VYTSDSNGYADVDFGMPDFTLDEAYPVAYRALVVHLSSGSSSARAGCGLIGAAELGVAKLDTYPGYIGYTVAGTVAVTTNSTGVTLVGTLTGVPASTTAGIHIHTGVSCNASADVGAHYYPDMLSDPWLSTTYTSDENGVATVSFSVDDFSLGGSNPVAGRAIVVHDSTDRIACGLIEPSTGKTMSCTCCLLFGNSVSPCCAVLHGQANLSRSLPIPTTAVPTMSVVPFL
jgi:Cu/Zn superoxide dismutase